MSGSRRNRLGLPIAFIVMLAVGVVAAPWWSPYVERAHNKIKRTLFPPPPKKIVKKKPTPPPLPPLPDRFYPKARMKTLPLTDGLDINLTIESKQGNIASEEREKPGAYALNVQLTYQVPRAATQLTELEKRDVSLASSWPGLTDLLSSARVSPFYHSLYERKIKFLEMRIDHVREIPKRHNMYDCDTVLELIHPESGRKALLIQADMDIVTDGSDSDRTLEVDPSSPTFQPFTAYNWAKQTKTINPLIEHYRSELAELNSKLASSSLNKNRRFLANRRKRVVNQTLEALKYRSSLVARLDPFIVVPGFMIKDNSPYAPQLGDYCLVFYQDRIWPAIVGDSGPYSKMGEASLKIAKEIDPTVSGSARSRPVSSLGVTYLIFPKSGEDKMAPPNLEQWQAKTQTLFAEVGGTSEAILSWDKVLETSNALPIPEEATHLPDSN